MSFSPLSPMWLFFFFDFSQGWNSFAVGATKFASIAKDNVSLLFTYCIFWLFLILNNCTFFCFTQTTKLANQATLKVRPKWLSVINYQCRYYSKPWIPFFSSECTEMTRLFFFFFQMYAILLFVNLFTFEHELLGCNNFVTTLISLCLLWI